MKDEIILWRPSDAFRQQSNLHSFEKWLDTYRGLQFEDYHALWKWSTTDIAGFWRCIWDYFDIDHDGDLTTILEGTEMPDVEWFSGVKINYTEHIFRHKSVDRPALMYASEGHSVQSLSWFDLEERVKSLRFFMQKSGVKPGDRVVAYLPNSPEAMIAFLAANSLGAIWSCCSPDFGGRTVIDRFEQIEPVCFIGVDGYAYNGKEHHRLAQTKQIAEALTGVKVKIISKNIGTEEALPGWSILQDIFKHETIDLPLHFVRLPFSAPIWILFSSGTTGKPKAITHSQGGVLLEHLKYLHLHNDVHEGEVFFWFTTTGWMMWNFLQASMLVGAVPLLYDGSPGYPDLSTLWKLADDVDLAHFGTSAPFLVACKNQGISPGRNHDLRPLRSIGSTGSPLPAETYDWVYSQVGSHIWLSSMSGGTDVCTAFVGGNPSLPVQRGRIQSRSLGCAMYPYGSDGKRLTEGIGEMIIEQPMPSMPICLWNDPQRKRLRSSYYEDFPGLWRHGDYIQIFEDGSLEILGRSDATLNRKGVRIGTAEIYAVLDSIKEVEDSLILNLEHATGEDFMPLFVKLGPECALDSTLVNRIRSSLRNECSPRHVPDLILSVPDIPYTLSGKKMEIPIKKIMLGMSIEESAQKDAVRNPQALEYFKDLAPTFEREHLS